MRRVIGGLVLALLLVTAGVAGAQELGPLRVGVLKFGTVNWELDVIERHELDRQYGFDLQVTGFGNNDAADVALMGEAVDMIVEDWLFVTRQRQDGVALSFIPYSSSVGALMAQKAGVASLADLAGKRIGVAGGRLDKSWLLLQALAKQEHGLDLAQAAEPAYGAPPLLAEKFRQGELDAVLIYWQFAARLEAEGYPRLMGVGEVAEKLGAPGDTVQLGYIFKESWGTEHAPLIQAFADASRAAKKIMAESDEEWERLRERTGAESDAVLEALKRRYREGIPQHWNQADREAAQELFTVLAKVGGEPVVGSAKTLEPGTFWPDLSY